MEEIMSKLFDELENSLTHAIEIGQGRRKPNRVYEYDEVEIVEIRKKLKLTQQELANLMGTSKGTIENWEQGRRRPTGPARALLKILQAKPKMAITALQV
jgi:putative transcriptional regulator